MTDHFTSVNTMIENLRADDPELRLVSMRGVHLIAQTLGPDRTRAELLPYLTDYLDENDEVLRVFANALATMIAEVGGVQHAGALLAPLELLCGLDEVTVRDEAVASLYVIAEQVYREPAAAGQQAEIAALVLRLCKDELPQKRASAAALIAAPYPHVAVATRASLRQALLKLCSDDEIIVRRAACVALGRTIAKALGQQCTDLLTAFASFCRDASDGVRLQAVPAAIALLGQLPDSGTPQVVSLIKTLSADSSWRVRFMVADRLGDISRAFPPPDVPRVAVPIFRTLCQDAEAEIRASVVFNMHGLLATVGSDAAAKREVLAAGVRTANDQNAHVRMSLASALLRSVEFLAREQWAAHVVPTCTKLLQDPDADVRLALVSGFSSMASGASEARELAPKLIPVVSALATDAKWRIREVVVSQMPAIVSALGRTSAPTASTEDVIDTCVRALSDRVAAIRASAAGACVRLLDENGPAWAKATLFPRILPLATAEGFLKRVTLLQLLTVMAASPQLDASLVTSTLLPAVSGLAADRVANVRLNAARALVALRQSGKAPRGEVDSLLSKLQTDDDADVRTAALSSA